MHTCLPTLSDISDASLTADRAIGANVLLRNNLLILWSGRHYRPLCWHQTD